MGGIATVAAAIGADLAARLPRQNKKQREGLALLVSTPDESSALWAE